MLKKLLLVVAMLLLPMAFTTGCSDSGGTATPAVSPTDDGSGGEEGADATDDAADAGNTTE